MTRIQAKDAIRIRAGREALRRLKRDGLKPEDIGVIPGAAGGPKAVGIVGLDRAVFPWLAGTPRRRELVGASIGGWRMTCALQHDPAAAFDRLTRAYTDTVFASADRAAITRATREMRDRVFDHAALAGALTHPDYRLTLLAAASRGPLNRETTLPLAAGLAGAIALNTLSRRLLGRAFIRVICHDPRSRLDFLPDDGIPTRTLPLTEANLAAALMATAAIPGVIAPVELPELPGRLLRDGGLTDYHVDLPFAGGPDLVLYPHFTERIIPGWFDKWLPWRNADPDRQANTVVIAPSPAYLAGLSLGKLPSRADFKRFYGQDAERQRLWRQASAESERLGDAFLQLVDSGEIAAVVRPLVNDQ